MAAALLDHLHQQAVSGVEILALEDNMTRSIGAKRNALLGASQGRYVVFVDDDDWVADDYVASLLAGAEQHVDVVTFNGEVTLNGGTPFLVRYSLEYRQSHNLDRMWLRIPNHLCAIRRELAVAVSFPDVCVGEDADYATRLRPTLRTEHHIERVLYWYRYRDDTTLTQGPIKTRPPQAI